MTYHSAKGLQFETEILPFYSGVKTNEDCKALYVTMTRTYRNLYIIYSGALHILYLMFQKGYMRNKNNRLWIHGSA